MRINYSLGSELPDLSFTWRDASGALIAFGSIAHSFTLWLATSPAFSKTTGFTGADTDPNVTMTFTTTDLNALSPGIYAGQLWARRTSDSKDRVPLRFMFALAAPIV